MINWPENRKTADFFFLLKKNPAHCVKVYLLVLGESVIFFSKNSFLALGASLGLSCFYPLFVPACALDNSQALNFWQVVKKDFAAWDLDNSGFLSREEIDEDIQNAAITGEDAAALSALKVYLRGQSDKEAYLEGFTLNALSPFETAADSSEFAASSSALSGQGRQLVNLFGKYLVKINRENVRLYGRDMPHLDTIRQGKTGDCYFLATVGGLAYHDPQRLKNLIAANEDGSYSVTFPRHKAIRVSSPTDCEIACYSDAGSDGLWLHVLEKAYAIFKNKHGEEEALDVVIHGGSGGRMIMFLTGEVCTRYPNASTDGALAREVLARALAANKVVNTGTTGHCLTVLNYDQAGDNITIWNPWGTSVFYKAAGLKMQNGVFTMAFADFQKAFLSLLVEGDRPATSADYARMSHHK